MKRLDKASGPTSEESKAEEFSFSVPIKKGLLHLFKLLLIRKCFICTENNMVYSPEPNRLILQS